MSDSFTREPGTSMLSLPARMALRMRVRRSAIGSVIAMGLTPSPARLDQSGDMPLAGVIPETDAAHAKTAEKCARAAAQRTAVVLPHLELIRPFCLYPKTCLGQRIPPTLSRERHPEVLEQRSALIIALRRRHNGNREAARFVDFVGHDLGKDDLVAEPERIIAAAVERLGRNPFEVAHARQRRVNEAVEELVHAVPP